MAASLLLHVAALYAADRSDLLQGASERSLTINHAHAPSPDPRSIAPEAPTCEANASLAAAAHLVVCASPLFKRSECANAIVERLSLGLSVCNALANSSEIDLVPKQTIDEIAAEPLLDMIDPADQAKVPESELALLAEPPKPTPPPPPPLSKGGQVVETAKPKKQQAPEHSNLVSEYDSKVEKQTVAHGPHGAPERVVDKPEQANLKPVDNRRKATAPEVPDKPAEKVSKNPDDPAGKGALVMRKPGESRPAQAAKVKEIAGALTGIKVTAPGAGLEVARGTAAANQEAQEASAGDTRGGGGRPIVPNLMPSKAVLERAIGGGSVDHLPDVEKGENTTLNTHSWQFASFYNRVKRRVMQNYSPSGVYARRDPNGNIFGHKKRTTDVTVTLDPKGKIRAIVISRKSGIDVLDAEAVRAFRRAQPFPNPPQALVDPRTGMIIIYFSFVFDAARPDRWRVFRLR